MDNKEDTLIISASDNNDINVETIDLSKLSTINLEDLIKDIDIDYSSSNMASAGALGSAYYSSAIGNSWPALQPLSTQQISSMPYTGNITINSNATSPIYSWGSLNSGQSVLKVQGDAEIEGDIKWKGRSLGDMLETIERRLSILVPDPEKLAHYESLKKAYEHYKTLEALCDKPEKEEE